MKRTIQKKTEKYASNTTIIRRNHQPKNPADSQNQPQQARERMKLIMGDSMLIVDILLWSWASWVRASGPANMTIRHFIEGSFDIGPVGAVINRTQKLTQQYMWNFQHNNQFLE